MGGAAEYLVPVASCINDEQAAETWTRSLGTEYSYFTGACEGPATDVVARAPGPTGWRLKAQCQATSHRAPQTRLAPLYCKLTNISRRTKCLRLQHQTTWASRSRADEDDGDMSTFGAPGALPSTKPKP